MRRATRSWWRLKHEVRRCQKPSSKNWSKISSVLPTWLMRNHPPSRWRRLSQMPWRAGDLESDLGWQEGPGYQILDQGSWIHLSCADRPWKIWRKAGGTSPNLKVRSVATTWDEKAWTVRMIYLMGSATFAWSSSLLSFQGAVRKFFVRLSVVCRNAFCTITHPARERPLCRQAWRSVWYRQWTAALSGKLGPQMILELHLMRSSLQ